MSKLLILMAQSASELARRHGTEEDRINGPFFFKIGACRHGETCTRKHNKPPFSQTVLIKKMYYNPMIPLVNSGTQVGKFDQLTLQQVFDDFLEEIVEELSKYGNLEDVQVMENLGDHMIGCVYAKYEDEEDAEKCLNAMNGRYYAGRKLEAEYTSVTDFREARCRSYDESICDRGSFCNFMHVRGPCKALRKYLEEKYNFTGCRVTGKATMASMRD